MNTQELEPTEIQGKLVSTGTFLVDKKEMEKMVDEELFKIANEALLPYKTYLQYSIKKFIPPFLGVLAGIGAIFSSRAFISNAEICAFFVVASSLTIVGLLIAICVEYDKHGFIFHPIYKLYLAKKIFKQAIKELQCEAMDNQIDLKLLKEKFIFKVQEIRNRKLIAKENKIKEKVEAEKKLQKTLSEAKYGLV